MSLQPALRDFAEMATAKSELRPILPLTRNGQVDLKAFAELVAPSCRMLRQDIANALADPASPMLASAGDWRELLFPEAADREFADAYAQTVTFALLLGRSEGAEPLTLESAQAALAARHSLLSRALQVLTDHRVRGEMAASLDLLLRVMAVVPPAPLAASGDPWLYFYEDFLAAYDPELRKNAGVYYTPVQVVRAQVRLIDELLTERLGKPLGFADPDVVVLDPAAGTGTYLLGIIEQALGRVEAEKGAGALPGQAAALAGNLHGFERLVGAYAVSELRVSRALQDRGASPDSAARIYLTDTLTSPHTQPKQLPLFMRPIAEQHEMALAVKRETRVLVCLGNPPYDRHEAATPENGERTGAWVRLGDEGEETNAILRDFIEPVKAAGRGGQLKNLYNLYVYFWRWALWKVFEHDADEAGGVVSFISASSYLDGDAFLGMREHLRRVCEEIWILDLSQEREMVVCCRPLMTLAGLAFALVAAGTFAGASTAVSTPQLTVNEDAAAYRRIHVEVTTMADTLAAGYEIWFADQAFQSTDEAELHSTIAVADVAGLKRGPAGIAYDECWSDGQPIHRSAVGAPVLSRHATHWACALSGMAPGREQWIAVLPVDANGNPLIDPRNLRPIAARTDAPDERTPPPDTRPILFALAAIVLSAAVLLIHLRRRDLREGRNRSRNAHLYVAPALLMLAMLTLYPILYGIGLAFTDADQSRLGDESWVGLANFAVAFSGPGMWRMAGFTLVWTVGNVAAHVLFGLALAVALNHPRLRGRTVYRTVLLLPWAIPGYISVLAWNGMLQPDGLVNGILGTSIEFLGSAGSAQTSVILVNIWLGVPFMMMVFSGALQGIPPDMFEAARIDGVSRWQQFRHLTLPNLKTTLVPVSLLGFIWTFNMFNTIYLMTRGNPYVGFGEPGATDIMVTHIFALAFEEGRYGMAAAGSVLVFLMLIGFSWAYLSRTRATEAAA